MDSPSAGGLGGSSFDYQTLPVSEGIERAGVFGGQPSASRMGSFEVGREDHDIVGSLGIEEGQEFCNPFWMRC